MIKGIKLVRNTREFWITVNKFNKKTPKCKLEISIEECVTHFQNIYAPSPRITNIFLTNVHTILDKPISLIEVQTALAQLKNDEAPGTDGITMRRGDLGRHV